VLALTKHQSIRAQPVVPDCRAPAREAAGASAGQVLAELLAWRLASRRSP